MTMQALVLPGWQQTPTLRDVPVPEPGPGEVLLRVAGAGACHSDLHLMEFPPGAMPFDPPFVLGHENTGWVERNGPGADTFAVGDAVAVYGPWGCGHCRACASSEENYCERAGSIGKMAPGIGHDGGMAQFLRVPERLLVPLGGLDPIDAAPLTDAALTPYHAIKRSLSLLVPGSIAVVIGAGGLGHVAVQLLKALSPSYVVTVDQAASKLEQALDLGADDAVEPSEAAARVRSLSGGLGAELVLDLVGSDETLALAVDCARVRGDITVVGLAGGTLPYRFFGIPYECSVASTYWGSAVELREVIALARAGRIHVQVERFTLDRAVEAYGLLRDGRIEGRAVVTPNGPAREASGDGGRSPEGGDA
jgi:propanol-preferring alcohol dehydrogenase